MFNKWKKQNKGINCFHEKVYIRGTETFGYCTCIDCGETVQVARFLNTIMQKLNDMSFRISYLEDTERLQADQIERLEKKYNVTEGGDDVVGGES